ncbi:hypothetical protein GGF31_001013 [Allomyces arbusculus]|nr:hypothetical protein GGF31_001013 [Allomyces arbusculus]
MAAATVAAPLSAQLADRPLTAQTDCSDFDLRRLVNELALENEELRAKMEHIVENNQVLLDENTALRRRLDVLRMNQAHAQSVLDQKDEDLRSARAQLARAQLQAAGGAPPVPPPPGPDAQPWASAPASRRASRSGSFSAAAPGTAGASRASMLMAAATAGGDPDAVGVRATPAGTRLARMVRLMQELVQSMRQEMLVAGDGETPQSPQTDVGHLPLPRAVKILDALDRLAESVHLEADAAAHTLQAAHEERVAALDAELQATRRAADAHAADARDARARGDAAAAQVRQLTRALTTAQQDLAQAIADRDAAMEAAQTEAENAHEAQETARVARDDHFRLRRKAALDAAELDRLRADLNRANVRLADLRAVLSTGAAAGAGDAADLAAAAAVGGTKSSGTPRSTAAVDALPATADIETAASAAATAAADMALAAQLAPLVLAIEKLVASITSGGPMTPEAAKEQLFQLATLRAEVQRMTAVDLAERVRRGAEDRARLYLAFRQQQAELIEVREAYRTARASEDFLVSEVEVLKRVAAAAAAKPASTVPPTPVVETSGATPAVAPITTTLNVVPATAKVEWGEFLLAELRRLVQMQQKERALRASDQANEQRRASLIDPDMAVMAAAVSQDGTASSPITPTSPVAMQQVSALEDEVATLTRYISQILNRIFEAGDPHLVETVLSKDGPESGKGGNSWRDVASGILQDAARKSKRLSQSRRGSRASRSSTIGAGTAAATAAQTKRASMTVSEYYYSIPEEGNDVLATPVATRNVATAPGTSTPALRPLMPSPAPSSPDLSAGAESAPAASSGKNRRTGLFRLSLWPTSSSSNNNNASNNNAARRATTGAWDLPSAAVVAEEDQVSPLSTRSPVPGLRASAWMTVRS